MRSGGFVRTAGDEERRKQNVRFWPVCTGFTHFFPFLRICFSPRVLFPVFSIIGSFLVTLLKRSCQLQGVGGLFSSASQNTHPPSLSQLPFNGNTIRWSCSQKHGPAQFCFSWQWPRCFSLLMELWVKLSMFLLLFVCFILFPLLLEGKYQSQCDPAAARQPRHTTCTVTSKACRKKGVCSGPGSV